MVKSGNWQLSQVRTRWPRRGEADSISSLISKQWQVGHRNVQMPQPMQARAISSHCGDSKFALSLAECAIGRP